MRLKDWKGDATFGNWNFGESLEDIFEEPLQKLLTSQLQYMLNADDERNRLSVEFGAFTSADTAADDVVVRLPLEGRDPRSDRPYAKVPLAALVGEFIEYLMDVADDTPYDPHYYGVLDAAGSLSASLLAQHHKLSAAILAIRAQHTEGANHA